MTPQPRPTVTLALVALGVVYGDIGTSPLYAIRECFHGPHAVPVTPGNVLGVLSMVLWTLLLIVTVKYVLVLLHADNRGEGGILALTTLVTDPRPRSFRWRQGSVLLMLGLFAAALLYGDGVITPAISVLSAIEGIEVVTPAVAPWVMPIALVVLAALFFVQYRGTARVGKYFGPIALLWFFVIGALGLMSLVKTPAVLAAIDPRHAIAFFAEHGLSGIIVLGSVFLVATGAEAIYADLGHFGRSVIHKTWFAVALPALALNYLGQAALLLRDPAAGAQPFFLLVPSPLLIPVLVLATVATCIASQAVITGAFSLTAQAIQLGYLPRLEVRHTSREERGQIYIPEVNWLLFVLTSLVVVSFHTSTALAAAYGIAVTSTMVITSVFLFYVLRARMPGGALAAAAVAGAFLVIDGTFFAANALKLAHGGFFPVLLALAIVTVMTSWATGRRLLNARLRERSATLEDLKRERAAGEALLIAKTAIFLTRELDRVPPAMTRLHRHFDVLPSHAILMRVVSEPIPHLAEEDRITVESPESDMCRVVVRYGFMESPDIPAIVAQLPAHGLTVDPDQVVYVLGRETILATERHGMALWRERLFGFPARTAAPATAFFNLPPRQVIEIGAEIDL